MPYHAYRELLEDDPDYYTMPPKAENPNHDIPRVSFRVTIFRLHNIDTKCLTLDTKVGIVMCKPFSAHSKFRFSFILS